MVRRLLLSLTFACLCLNLTAATDPKLLLIEQQLQGFSDLDYNQSVERMLTEYENKTGVGLKPGQLRKCGLKISSQAGLGLATPKSLIRALGNALMKRGFEKQSVILCDVRQESLRECGFLPQLSTDADKFEGFPVIAFEPQANKWSADKKLC